MAHTYNLETTAWVQDPTDGWAPSKVIKKDIVGNKATLVFEITSGSRKGEAFQRITTVEALEGNKEDKNMPPLMNPPILEASDDLTSLSHLNEPAVLQAIKLRYAKREIYTYSGIVLIAANPFERMDYLYDPGLVQAYAGKRKEDQDPHLFAIADTAYQAMLREKKNQTIIVSGESGAGKTVSAKYIMRYFATVEDPNRPGKRRKGGMAAMSKTEEQILATNPIMEAFGNAKTTRNDNSSRFGKYIEILFDKEVEIIGAKIRTYLLERARLVFQPSTERNYHIFYQLISGASDEERQQLGLKGMDEFFFTNQGGDPVIPGMDDADEFRITKESLLTIGVDEDTQALIWRVLAALLHLGNMEIQSVRNGSVLNADEPSLVIAAKLLGVNAEEFAKWTTKKQLVMRNERTVTPLSHKQSVVVRDSIAKFIYSSLFDWLVEIINDSLATDEVRKNVKSFIGVLDIYGFEHFKRNSFEQFCINYANEKLQHQFNQHVFQLEQDEYAMEHINWQYIEFSDNKPCIDLIEGKMGILSLLDEESRLPAGSDDSMITKMNQNFGTRGKEFPYQVPRFGKSTFTVCHYAVDVSYDSEGFVEKNRDTVPDEHLALLGSSTNPFLTSVLRASATHRDKESGTPSMPGGPSPTAVPVGSRKHPSQQSSRKPTLGYIFRSSLNTLMGTIQETSVHYIRCIKPNEGKEAWKFEGPMVLSQLQACGVLETVKISCAGYPTRWTYEDFASRYYMLIHSSELKEGAVRDVGLRILEKTIPPEGHPRVDQKDGKDKYQLGMSKIFFRAGMLAVLENLRASRLNECATLIQKNLKQKYYRRRYLEARAAILKTQAYARGYLARKTAHELRIVKAATTIQRVWRGSKQREAYHTIRNSVIKVQAAAKGYLCRKSITDRVVGNAARYIQKAWRSRRFLMAWALYRKRVVYLQSIWRGKIARKEYKVVREEARDLKQISYKLENKVIELTQAVGMLKKDNKALLEKVESFDNQVKSWRQKHANLENRNKELQIEANQAGIAEARLSQMDDEMKLLQSQFEESTANMKRLQEEGKSLRESLTQRTAELDQFKSRDKMHEDEKQSLRLTIQNLEDQLQNAGPPVEEVVEKSGGVASGLINFVTNKKPKRRSAEVTGRVETNDMYRSSYQARPVSMMPISQPARTQFDTIQFTPTPENSEQELLRILEDEEVLSEEVSIGLIKNLKVPPLNAQTPLQYKEVLFPAYLINVVTSEMWNNGFVKESERFLANVMQSIQHEVMTNHDEDAITQGAFWLSNVHEMLSFVFLAEDWYEIQKKDDYEYDRLLEVVKHDLESLEFNIYHTWMKVLKRKLQKMIIPAIIESQSLPGFVTNDGNRFLNKLLQTNSQPQFSMDDLLSLLNKVYKAMKTYYVEDSIVAQTVTELLKLVGVTAFNDLLLRRNFLSWKRGLQINYNITRIEEWCKSNDMPEGILQLEHLMQATKLLQLKKATLSDIEIIQDICWMLSPNQIQKLLNQYLVADYEQPINGEIMKAVASRVTEKTNDVLLLQAVDMDDSGPYEIPEPRQIGALETYCPSYLQTPKLRRLADVVSAQAKVRAEEAAMVEEGSIGDDDTTLADGEGDEEEM